MNRFEAKVAEIEKECGADVARAFTYFCLQVKAVIYMQRRLDHVTIPDDDEWVRNYIEVETIQSVKIGRNQASKWLETLFDENCIESKA